MPTRTQTAKKSYSQLSQELDELMDWFESENADLDVALDKYHQAIKLIEAMEKYLQTAENKLKKINVNLQT